MTWVFKLIKLPQPAFTRILHVSQYSVYRFHPRSACLLLVYFTESLGISKQSRYRVCQQIKSRYMQKYFNNTWIIFLFRFLHVNSVLKSTKIRFCHRNVSNNGWVGVGCVWDKRWPCVWAFHVSKVAAESKPLTVADAPNPSPKAYQTKSGNIVQMSGP